MPKFDKTGPSGQGPVTGRGFGPCSKNQSQNKFGGRCCGRRMGFGGRNFSFTLEEEEKFLKQKLELIQKEKTDKN